jgi:hypothetical protein
MGLGPWMDSSVVWRRAPAYGAAQFWQSARINQFTPSPKSTVFPHQTLKPVLSFHSQITESEKIVLPRMAFSSFKKKKVLNKIT